MFVDSVNVVLQRYLERFNEPAGPLSLIVNLTERIPEKIRYFQLPEDKLNDMRTRQGMLECAISLSMEKETLRNHDPASLLEYAGKLEQKYSGDIAHMKYFLDHVALGTSLESAVASAIHFVRNKDDQEALLHGQEAHIPISIIDRSFLESLREVSGWTGGSPVAGKILASWFIHFSVLNHYPAEKDLGVLARLIQWVFLQNRGVGVDSMLFFSLEIMKDQAVYRRIAEQLRHRDYQQFLTADMTEVYQFGLNWHLSAIQSLNRDILRVYQALLEYEEFTPKQRNMVNYFFDEGYRHVPELEALGLNDRLTEIMEHIYRHHFTSTKDMSLYFRCNRKTIQRDFNELLDRGLVRAMGKGAALRYTVSLENSASGLSSYQNINLSDTPVQISLFDSQTMGTKKIPQERD